VVAILKKFIVEMIPSFVKKIFVEVEAEDHGNAVQLAVEVFNENRESINFNNVIDYEIAARTEATHRSLINAKHQKKNKKENITFTGINKNGDNDSRRERSSPTLGKVSRVVEIGARENFEQRRSTNLSNDVGIEKMGIEQPTNGFVDDNCREEKSEVVNTPDEVLNFEKLEEEQEHK
jgi:hypothetical protein